jgi:hypothetical protein
VNIQTTQFALTDRHHASFTVNNVQPQLLRLVLVCTTADAGSGLNPGDEIDCYAFQGIQCFSAVWTAGHLALTFGGYSGTSALVTLPSGGGSLGSFSNFSLKAYWFSGVSNVQTAQFALTEGTLGVALGVITARPQLMRLALICTAADIASGLNPGDEIDAYAVFNTGNENSPFSASWWHGQLTLNYDGSTGDQLAVALPGGVGSFSSMNNFAVRAYWI